MTPPDLAALATTLVVVALGRVARSGPAARRPLPVGPSSAPPPASDEFRRAATVGRTLRDRLGRIASLKRRRAVIRPEAVATWCDEISRQVRAGCTLSASLSESTPQDPAMLDATGPLRRSLARGQPVAEAVGAPMDHGGVAPRGAHHLTFACSMIGVLARVGGSPAAPLDRVAASLRLRAVDRQERLTNAAQAQMSARVLTLVPLAMLMLLLITDPDVRAAVAGPIGGLCVAIGLMLNLVGYAWMRHTIGTTT